MKKQICLALMILFLPVTVYGGNVLASEEKSALKIGTINLQKIMRDSKAGQNAKEIIENKVAEFRQKFEGQQDELLTLKNEIEKKSSVWSEDVRSEKQRDYEKKIGVLKVESEVAQNEMKQLEKKLMEPVVKELAAVINEVGREQGFSLVLEYNPDAFRSVSGVFYASDSIDISEIVLKKLDSRAAKK